MSRKLNEWLDFPMYFRVCRTLGVLAMSMHLFACGFWRLKSAADPSELIDFLHSRGLSVDDTGQNYALCMYFICTVFCTVGFGDISASNHSERVCVT
mmetsp:Transcript_21267/g.44673  ORF Transcript_21267/g.44673 Transcript_21267/m.44673 type:complete len:97 (+) Transcript_21267:1581-1871(+)